MPPLTRSRAINCIVAPRPRGATPPAWCTEYVGLPFLDMGRDRDGVDCWGLYRLVLWERFGLLVPSYADDCGLNDDAARRAALIEARRDASWTQVVPPPSEGTFREGYVPERPGDAVLMRADGAEWHVGIVVAPGWMLHVRRGVDSALERYDDSRWRHRVVGIWRHG